MYNGGAMLTLLTGLPFSYLPPAQHVILVRDVVAAGGDVAAVTEWVTERGGFPDRTPEHVGGLRGGLPPITTPGQDCFVIPMAAFGR